ncbi:hypothetical protein C8R48DRAFT_464326 [Suillus tomentosus]|nr:hypothetical protein C8R48DRAFT_464326 [Suillus tomentosus]
MIPNLSRLPSLFKTMVLCSLHVLALNYIHGNVVKKLVMKLCSKEAGRVARMPRPRIHCSESHPPTISDNETIRLFLRPNNCSATKRTNYKLKMVSLKKMKIIRYTVYNGFGVDSAATGI